MHQRVIFTVPDSFLERSNRPWSASVKMIELQAVNDQNAKLEKQLSNIVLLLNVDMKPSAEAHLEATGFDYIYFKLEDKIRGFQERNIRLREETITSARHEGGLFECGVFLEAFVFEGEG